jgi:hypothetical protein
VNRLGHQLDAAEIEPDITAEGLVMVAGYVDDARAVLCLFEDAAHDIVVARRPVPALPQLPAVDDVPDQVERLAIDRFQEVEQQLGVAARGSEMRVGDPCRAHGEPRPMWLEMDGLFDPVR